MFKLQKRKTKKTNALTFTKRIVIFILILAELEVIASYVLAFMGKSDIAEALSIQIVITIIGTITGYFIKSLVENIFKNNKIFKEPEVDVTKVTIEEKNSSVDNNDDESDENGRKG